jgi:hypothetical protein
VVRLYDAEPTTLNSGQVSLMVPASVPVPKFVSTNDRSAVWPTVTLLKSRLLGVT